MTSTCTTPECVEHMKQVRLCTPLVQFSGVTLLRILDQVAEYAWAANEPVTVVGAIGGSPVLCTYNWCDCADWWGHVTACPDVFILECQANGITVPYNPFLLTREDGRSCLFFQGLQTES